MHSTLILLFIILLDQLVFLFTIPGSRACGSPHSRGGDRILCGTGGRQYSTELENAGPEAMDFLQKLYLDYSTGTVGVVCEPLRNGKS